jgi:hypothetical protein
MDFVPIAGYPDYIINRKGEIIKKTGKIMKLSKSSTGYFKVGLTFNKKRNIYFIHRLLALTFIDNPNNYKVVDHINRIRDDNRLENLRWVSNCENSQNSQIRCKNKSGHKHICKDKTIIRDKEYSYWFVQIKHNYECICRSKFKTLEEAIKHRDKILKELNREIIQ